MQCLFKDPLCKPMCSECNDSSDKQEKSHSRTGDVPYLTQRVLELENILSETGRNLKSMLDQKCFNVDVVNCLNQKFDQVLLSGNHTLMTSVDNLNSLKGTRQEMKTSSMDASTSTDDLTQKLEEKIKFYEGENNELNVKCTELEQCVDLLKTEYEKCEDYWANKLDEERQMFVQDQTQSSEKIADLMSKVTEYEEQLINHDSVDSRLPPIQETYNLEKQFTDLEREFEEYKEVSCCEISRKDEEISSLTKKLTALRVDKSKLGVEVGIQVDDDTEYTRIESKMRNLSNHVAECTNLYSADTMPLNWDNRSAISQLAPSPNGYNDPAYVWNKQPRSATIPRPESQQSNHNFNTSSTQSLPVCWQQDSQPTSLTNAGSTSSSSLTLDKSGLAPCRPKRTRKHDKNMQVYKKNNNHERELRKTGDKMTNGWKGIDDYKNNSEHTIPVPVSTIHNMNGRLHHLEQRCRHLQIAIKQQHYYAEQSLQYSWQQHKGEKAELQYLLKSNQDRLEQQIRVCNDQLEKLTRSDMLVKELYVENSYLIATVQRLQQRCDVLAQCNANSSV